MSYSDFTLKKVKSELKLKFIEDAALFTDIDAMAVSDYLTQTLRRNLPLALAINTEKARSELVIINILLEVKELTNNTISCKCSVPLLKKEGLGEILLNKSPSIPLFQRGR